MEHDLSLSEHGVDGLGARLSMGNVQPTAEPTTTPANTLVRISSTSEAGFLIMDRKGTKWLDRFLCLAGSVQAKHVVQYAVQYQVQRNESDALTGKCSVTQYKKPAGQ